MNRAYKFRIYPNRGQAELFAKTFGCVRFIYNKMLEDKLAHYKATGEQLNVTPAKYKKEYEFLREVDSLALANAQLNLETAYKNFFKEGTAGFPKFKCKKNTRGSYKTNNVKGNIKLKDNSVILPKTGAVKLKRHREIPGDYILKSVTVSKTPSGKYYASVLFEYEREIKPVEIKKAVGLNYSETALYIDSEGGKAQYGRHCLRGDRKLTKMSRKLSKMKKYSGNWYKQKRRIAAAREKAANRRMDFLHKQSRQIANACDLVGAENITAKTRRQAADISWSMFGTLLKYKLEEQGKYFVKVDIPSPPGGNGGTDTAVSIKNEALRMVKI